MSSLRNFLYRLPRFEASSRMDFIYGNTILLGSCIEISASGLRGTFSSAVLPGAKGLITLYEDNKSFSAQALILEVNENEVTARFEFQSQQEKSAIREFIRLVSTS